jgi:ABC-type lipoprotein release transport system permease subunit
MTLLVTGVFLAMIATLAVLAPAFRAAWLPPTQALRIE